MGGCLYRHVTACLHHTLLFVFICPYFRVGRTLPISTSPSIRLIALKGCAGLGNQIYQYLGLAASLRVARDAKLIDSSIRCEFVFSEAAVGPSDKDRKGRLANFTRASEIFSWPRDYCSIRASFSTQFAPSTTVNIQNLTLDSIQDTSKSVYNVDGNHCKFHSKSLCFISGISTAKYWQALTAMASVVTLRSDNLEASLIRRRLRKIDSAVSIGNSTLCVHVRGKGYEHHRGSRRRKVSVLVENLRLAIETYRQIKHSISHIHLITAMEIESVWSDGIETLSETSLQLMHSTKVTVKNENLQMLVAADNTLVNISYDNASTTDNIYLDLITMKQCSFLVVEEPLGRGTFSGSAAILSGKRYCTSMPWLLCNTETARLANFTVENPWSDQNVKRLLNPRSFRVAKGTI